MCDRDALARLIDEHRLLKEAIEQSPAAFCVYDEDDCLVAWNRAYAAAYPATFGPTGDWDPGERLFYGDMLRATFSQTMSGEALETEIAERLALQRQPDASLVERCYESIGWLRITKFALPSGGSAGIGVDINELKTRELELEAARAAAEVGKRAKADFLSHMSHEIRTPLNGVVGMAALLKATALDDRQRLFADAIFNSGEHLLRIINDVLDMSMVEANEMRIVRSPFDLHQTVEEVGALFAASAAEKGVTLHVRVRPSVPRAAIGDPWRLRQIIANLTGNAVKFTDAGHVLIDLDAEVMADGRLFTTIVVEDSGPGVPPDQRHAIFDRFSQGDQSPAQLQKGAGLGLSIVSSLARLMNGAARVEDAPGGGARFVVEVTLDPDPAADVEPPLRGSVLIVDESRLGLRIATERFRALGLSVTGVGDAAAAEVALRRAKDKGVSFDLALISNGETGDAVLRHIDATDFELSCAVALMAPIDDDTLMARAEARGAIAALPAPARGADLRAVAEAALDEQKVRAALRNRQALYNAGSALVS
ncbi:MAG: ATP-binding protein [Pseudomonadota bacterium]